jgi:hypothetical protein
MSVATLMTMPAARGLFHRAIIQSGSAEYVHTPGQALAVTRRLMSLLGIADGAAARLLDVPAAELIGAQAELSLAMRSEGGGLGLLFAPVADGSTVPGLPLAAFRLGTAARSTRPRRGSGMSCSRLLRTGWPTLSRPLARQYGGTGSAGSPVRSAAGSAPATRLNCRSSSTPWTSPASTVSLVKTRRARWPSGSARTGRHWPATGRQGQTGRRMTRPGRVCSSAVPRQYPARSLKDDDD